MKRLLSYFSPKMPVYVAFMLRDSHYNPDEFLDVYIKFRLLSTFEKGSEAKKSKKLNLYILSAYYIWAVYIISGLIVLQFSVLGGMIAFLASPLIVAGGLYTAAYVFLHLADTSDKLSKHKKSKKRN